MSTLWSFVDSPLVAGLAPPVYFVDFVDFAHPAGPAPPPDGSACLLCTPHKSASGEKQKRFETTALLARLTILGYAILALDAAACMVGGWNGYGWLPVGCRETIPMSWSKKPVRLIGVLGERVV